MSGHFGDSARRAWGAAAGLLGWAPDQFWNATPVELAEALAPPDALVEPFDVVRMATLRAQFPDMKE